MRVVCSDCGKRKPTHERPIKKSWKSTTAVCKKCYDAWAKADVLEFRRQNEELQTWLKSILLTKREKRIIEITISRTLAKLKEMGAIE